MLKFCWRCHNLAGIPLSYGGNTLWFWNWWLAFYTFQLFIKEISIIHYPLFIIHHCTHLNAVRNKLFSSIRVALGPASPACSSFFDAPDSIKTKVLLGAPSDDLNIDRRVDIAFRKFLLRVDALRHSHIAASYTVSQWHIAWLFQFKNLLVY